MPVGSVKIQNSGVDESVEGVSGIVLGFKAFVTQDVLEMLDKVVVVAQFVQHLQRHLCYMWPGPMLVVVDAFLQFSDSTYLL